MDTEQPKPNPTPLREIEFKEHVKENGGVCEGSGKKGKTTNAEPYKCPVCGQQIAVYMTVLE